MDPDKSSALSGAFAAAYEIQAVCHAAKWPFCFIGGLAVQRWGEPRMTADADLTIVTGFGTEAPVVDELLKHFPGRISEARQFALQHRVLLLKASNGSPIDVALGALPFEENSVARSSPWTVAEGLHLQTCSAEDLVVHKAFANRDHDWGDVTGILMRQGGKLDFKLIKRELQPLVDLKEEPGIMKRLDLLITRHIG